MAKRLPGIIVRIIDSAGIIAPPIFERYPVIIGEGDPYRLVEDQKVVRSAGSVDNLVSPTTIDTITSVGDLPGISKYVSGTDYQLSGGNRISWLPGGSSPTLGNNFYVTFTETRPASAYTPMLYFNENLIYKDHGNKVRTNGDLNDVSVGGSLALGAGAKGVIIAQLDLSGATDPDSPTNSELEAAFIAMRDELEKIEDYKLFLVPMSSGTIDTTSAANIFFNHAVLASQPAKKQERTVFAALPKNYTREQAATFAQSYAHERLAVPFAYEGKSYVVGDSSGASYDTRFYVAAVAGKLCSVPIGINISDEIIPGVLLEDNYTPEEMEWLLARGVGIGTIRGEVIRNRFIGTTDTTSALTEDLGVQDIKDYVKKYWREGLWKVYKNRPINDKLIAQITESSEGIMEYLTSEEIIAEHKNISVDQDDTEPRQVNVAGQVKPAFGMQWMDVEFTFVLSFT